MMLRFGLWFNRNLGVIPRHVSQANSFSNQCYKKQCFSSISITLCKKQTNDLKYVQLSKLMSTDSQKVQRKYANHIPVRKRIWFTIKNWIFIKRLKWKMKLFDNEFSFWKLDDYVRQTMVMVSNSVAKGNFKELSGIVDDNAIRKTRRIYSLLNIKERHDISVDLSDIFFHNDYKVKFSFDKKTRKAFCEITVVYYIIKRADLFGLEITDENIGEVLKTTRISICRYRFIREFTIGGNKSNKWIVNSFDHFYLQIIPVKN